MIAAIDVGSNTVRLLTARILSDGRIAEQTYLRAITRLGGNYVPEHGIDAEAALRTIAALKNFAGFLSDHPVTALRAVATEAVRRSVNAPQFIDMVQSETGLLLEIIDGEEEACLSASGVLSALDPLPPASLIFDIGGGSTEFILLAGRERLFHRSYPLGVVALAESPRPAESIDRILFALQTDLAAAGLLSQVSAPECELIGTAGTVTTLAALSLQMREYDWRRINNLTLPLTEVKRLDTMLTNLSLSAREDLPGMEKGRGDLILHGCAVILALCTQLNKSFLRVSDFGLLEGTLLSIG